MIRNGRKQRENEPKKQIDEGCCFSFTLTFHLPVIYYYYYCTAAKYCVCRKKLFQTSLCGSAVYMTKKCENHKIEKKNVFEELVWVQRAIEKRMP